MAELDDSPTIAFAYCPACDPERDPIRELLTVHCLAHEPKSDGVDDASARVGTDFLVSTGEIDAETNRRWCQLLHRPAAVSRREV